MDDVKMCRACQRSYSSVGNMVKHLKNSPVCRAWIDHVTKDPQRPEEHDDAYAHRQHCHAGYAFDRMEHRREEYDRGPLMEPTNRVITGTFIQEHLTPKGTTCPYCLRTFATTSGLTRHYKSSIVCDRWRAYDAQCDIMKYMKDNREKIDASNGRSSGISATYTTATGHKVNGYEFLDLEFTTALPVEKIA